VTARELAADTIGNTVVQSNRVGSRADQRPREDARLGNDPVPSTAALTRIFRDANVARAEPRKKPRASYRRFVYPAPHAC
jgi:hypothetical protein